MLNGGSLYLSLYSQLSPAWRQMSHLSRSCCCWLSFWSGLSSCRTPCPPPLRKVNLTEGSLCPLAGRDGGPDVGCGCGGFLSRATSSPVQHRHPSDPQLDNSPDPLHLCGGRQKGFRFLPHAYFQTTDSTCKNQNAERLTSYSWNGPIVLHGVFFSPWWVKRRRKSQVKCFIYPCDADVAALQCAVQTLGTQGPCVWTLVPSKSHPSCRYANTHTQAHWHSLAQLTDSHAAMTVPNWVYDQTKQHYPPKTHKQVCSISDKWTKIKWKKLELN